jgi:hypothetical protein
MICSSVNRLGFMSIPRALFSIFTFFDVFHAVAHERAIVD